MSGGGGLSPKFSNLKIIIASSTCTPSSGISTYISYKNEVIGRKIKHKNADNATASI